MAHAKITDTKSKLEAAQARAARANLTTKALEATLVRKASGVSAAAGYGAMKLMHVPIDIKGFPWKLGVWLGVTVVEALTKGAVQAAAAGLSDTTMAVYVYDAVAKKSVIAGDIGDIG